MKQYRFPLFLATGLLALSACDDINEQDPLSGQLTASQVQTTNGAMPSRTQSTFSGMFTMMGKPCYTFGTNSGRADDFGFVMMAISQDLEGPDACIANSGYNWFSACGEYTTRDPSYANPYLRYAMPYNQIKVANDIISSFAADTEDESAINQIAQAKAMRAFDYMAIAPYYQFRYEIAKDQPCVPLVTESTADPADNPRATVEEIYKLIISDLDYAIEHLEGFKRPNKAQIDINVAYGLRARAYLNMGKYAEAAADAAKAVEGYTPASLSELSAPSFYDINDHNWIWGINIDASMVAEWSYPTSASWIGSFSASSYSAGVQCYAFINNLLYNKISSTDVRKGWWVDENLHSPLLANVTWNGVSGDAVAPLEIDDVKMAFLPYTNVKFGMKSGIGSEINNNDWPLMRVEEMLLVEIEGLAKSGQEAQARTKLETFVKTYRDPSYRIPTTRTLADEIWFQRRVELWGEGFAMSDVMRLGKPMVRFHDNKSNYPEAFRFNIQPTDEWLLLRFPQSEMNANSSIVNNTNGTQPEQDQNAALRDGVTD
ncbi:MAG: RagB/SusD family nutrient uptake outer membrane protein [Bacteroides sp.]|nr:RagB/SusD family nutrient uptake outer membrane protein [Roseburia sp.]MCM1347657.1 RagB/SusD family nutrient uptake outer membrane protein [Bacteroides sp.]MCM1422060.1 RagB/SusD family nutrient uptake outer membrane protein [Bacteroides sp.]